MSRLSPVFSPCGARVLRSLRLPLLLPILLGALAGLAAARVPGSWSEEGRAVPPASRQDAGEPERPGDGAGSPLQAGTGDRILLERVPAPETRGSGSTCRTSHSVALPPAKIELANSPSPLHPRASAPPGLTFRFGSFLASAPRGPPGQP